MASSTSRRGSGSGSSRISSCARTADRYRSPHEEPDLAPPFEERHPVLRCITAAHGARRDALGVIGPDDPGAPLSLITEESTTVRAADLPVAVGARNVRPALAELQILGLGDLGQLVRQLLKGREAVVPDRVGILRQPEVAADGCHA